MPAAPTPAALAPIRVPAGTSAADALKAAGVPLKGADGAVVVRELASGDLKDLAWVPDADAEVEPVPAEAFGRFLVSWHGIGSAATGHDRLLEVIGPHGSATLSVSRRPKLVSLDSY